MKLVYAGARALPLAGARSLAAGFRPQSQKGGSDPAAFGIS